MFLLTYAVFFIVLGFQLPLIFLTILKCYDLRFPELSICQTQMGAEILTFPSAFTVVTGMAHWEVGEYLFVNDWWIQGYTETLVPSMKEFVQG